MIQKNHFVEECLLSYVPLYSTMHRYECKHINISIHADDNNIALCLLMKRRKEPSAEEKENVLVVLTNDGYLKVMSADTGFVFRSIFLSSTIKFRSAHTNTVLPQIIAHLL